MDFFLYLCGTKVAQGRNAHREQMLKFHLFSFTYCTHENK